MEEEGEKPGFLEEGRRGKIKGGKQSASSHTSAGRTSLKVEE
jgi:hypothetical protein